MTDYLIVPGWGGSGPSHWQTHWEQRLPRARRVQLADWTNPTCGAWLDAIDRALDEFFDPPVVIAHSLGAIAVVKLAAQRDVDIAAALLVAPADVEQARLDHLEEFAPIPRTTLPFPSRVVASNDDPYAALARVQGFASAWGSELTVLHGAGHINRESGFGPWTEGLFLARALGAEKAPARARSPRSYDVDDEADWIVRATD
jgi:predicted alpha/beta hydrolase family esterase